MGRIESSQSRYGKIPEKEPEAEHSRLVRKLSFRRKPESRHSGFTPLFWIPAYAGMTILQVSEQVISNKDQNCQRTGSQESMLPALLKVREFGTIILVVISVTYRRVFHAH